MTLTSTTSKQQRSKRGGLGEKPKQPNEQLTGRKVTGPCNTMYFTQVFLFTCLASWVVAAVERTEHGAHKTGHFKDLHNPVFDQEALMGSRHTDDLTELEPEVRKRRLSNLAKSHDTNNNGFIDKSELKQWILQSFRMLDREEAAERMTEDDENEDGKVTFSEMLHKQYGYTEEEFENMKNEEMVDGDEEEDTDVLEMVTDDKARFDAADLNNDKMLDDEEFIAFIQPYDYPHMFTVEMDKVLKDLDKDKDGSVSPEEFMGENLDAETRFSEMTNFEELDKDKDGKLSREELKPWALPDNDEVADEEVDHLVETSDLDKDGQLTIAEIVAKEDEFISSSATDYGRNLHFVRDEL